MGKTEKKVQLISCPCLALYDSVTTDGFVLLRRQKYWRLKQCIEEFLVLDLNWYK